MRVTTMTSNDKSRMLDIAYSPFGMVTGTSRRYNTIVQCACESMGCGSLEEGGGRTGRREFAGRAAKHIYGTH